METKNIELVGVPTLVSLAWDAALLAIGAAMLVTGIRLNTRPPTPGSTGESASFTAGLAIFTALAAAPPLVSLMRRGIVMLRLKSEFVLVRGWNKSSCRARTWDLPAPTAGVAILGCLSLPGVNPSDGHLRSLRLVSGTSLLGWFLYTLLLAVGSGLIMAASARYLHSPPPRAGPFKIYLATGGICLAITVALLSFYPLVRLLAYSAGMVHARGSYLALGIRGKVAGNYTFRIRWREANQMLAGWLAEVFAEPGKSR